MLPFTNGIPKFSMQPSNNFFSNNKHKSNYGSQAFQYSGPDQSQSYNTSSSDQISPSIASIDQSDQKIIKMQANFDNRFHPNCHISQNPQSFPTIMEQKSQSNAGRFNYLQLPRSQQENMNNFILEKLANSSNELSKNEKIVPYLVKLISEFRANQVHYSYI